MEPRSLLFRIAFNSSSRFANLPHFKEDEFEESPSLNRTAYALHAKASKFKWLLL